MKLPFINIEENEHDEVVLVAIDEIKPNSYQPRKEFDTEAIRELAESIKNFGVIQPLTVRPKGDKYELIAGERRLRASKYLGLDEVPVIIRDLSDQETAEISLVENLQRRDLDFIEEANAYSRLLEDFNLTQKELAERVGKGQSTVANKLRILNLPSAVISELETPEVTERHARALLRLANEDTQLEVVMKIKSEGLTVRETSALVEEILAEDDSGEGKQGEISTIVRDMRVFTNSLNSTIREMEKAGLDVEVDKKEKDSYIEYNIRLPKASE
ncbi:MAG: nucleoid occlusion protein [Halanaerobiales bacterium]